MKSENRLLCPLCAHEVTQSLYDGIEKNGKYYSVLYCQECDIAVTEPFPEKGEVDQLYSADIYRAHDGRFIYPIEWLIRRFSSMRLNKVEQLGKKGRLLDIGCARGLFLSLAQERGWNVNGLELNEETAYYARSGLSMDVRTGAINAAGFEERSFDAITIWHVLEHLADPVKTVRECSRLLKHDGLLVVSVPNLSSLQASLSRERWFHLDVPYHLYHFSLQSIKKLLNMHYFEVLKINHFSLEYNVYGFFQSILNIVSTRHNLIYDILKSKKLKRQALKGAFLDFILNSIAIPITAPVAFLLSNIEAIFKRGGTIEIYARKRMK